MTRTELKNAKSLLTRKGRKKHRMFIAEGVRLLEEARRHKFRPEMVCYAPAILSERGSKLAGQFGLDGVRVEKLSSRQLEGISDSKSPQGIMAVFKTPDTAPMEPGRLRGRNVLMCEDISDPGNLGSLARSALAFGFGTVVLTGKTVEPYSPKVVRASAGAVFGLVIVETETADILKRANKAKTIVMAAVADRKAAGTIPKGSKDGIMLAVGSEAEGLSEMLLKEAKTLFAIKHRAGVESLNAAVAGSIIMSMIYNQSRGR